MDIAIMEIINQYHNNILNSIMIFITHLGDLGFIWLVIAFYYFIKGQRKRAVGLVLCLLFGVLLTEVIFKPLIMRPRPFMYNENLVALISAPSSSSMPSGHALTSMACATYLFKNKISGYLILMLGILISFSRIYVNVHHPSDVLVGMIFGVIIGFVMKKILEKYSFGFDKLNN